MVMMLVVVVVVMMRMMMMIDDGDYNKNDQRLSSLKIPRAVFRKSCAVPLYT